MGFLKSFIGGRRENNLGFLVWKNSKSGTMAVSKGKTQSNTFQRVSFLPRNKVLSIKKIRPTGSNSFFTWLCIAWVLYNLLPNLKPLAERAKVNSYETLRLLTVYLFCYLGACVMPRAVLRGVSILHSPVTQQLISLSLLPVFPLRWSYHSIITTQR